MSAKRVDREKSGKKDDETVDDESKWHSEDQVDKEYNQPKVDEGYKDDNDYDEPYRHITNWFFSKPGCTKTLRKSLPNSPTSFSQTSLYGELIHPKEPEKKKKRKKVVISKLKCWNFDRHRYDRGVWILSKDAWYYLQRPCKRTVHLRDGTAISQNDLHLSFRANLGLLSNIVDMMCDKDGILETKLLQFHANCTPEESHSKLSLSKMEISQNPSAMKQPFDINLLRREPKFVRDHLKDLDAILNSRSAFFKGLGLLESKLRNAKRRNERWAVGDFDYETSARMAEERSNRKPWGNQNLVDGVWETKYPALYKLKFNELQLEVVERTFVSDADVGFTTSDHSDSGDIAETDVNVQGKQEKKATNDITTIGMRQNISMEVRKKKRKTATVSEMKNDEHHIGSGVKAAKMKKKRLSQVSEAAHDVKMKSQGNKKGIPQTIDVYSDSDSSYSWKGNSSLESAALTASTEHDLSPRSKNNAKKSKNHSSTQSSERLPLDTVPKLKGPSKRALNIVVPPSDKISKKQMKGARIYLKEYLDPNNGGVREEKVDKFIEKVVNEDDVLSLELIYLSIQYLTNSSSEVKKALFCKEFPENAGVRGIFIRWLGKSVQLMENRYKAAEQLGEQVFNDIERPEHLIAGSLMELLVSFDFIQSQRSLEKVKTIFEVDLPFYVEELFKIAKKRNVPKVVNACKDAKAFLVKITSTNKKKVKLERSKSVDFPSETGKSGRSNSVGLSSKKVKLGRSTSIDLPPPPKSPKPLRASSDSAYAPHHKKTKKDLLGKALGSKIGSFANTLKPDYLVKREEKAKRRREKTEKLDKDDESKRKVEDLSKKVKLLEEQLSKGLSGAKNVDFNLETEAMKSNRSTTIPHSVLRRRNSDSMTLTGAPKIPHRNSSITFTNQIHLNGNSESQAKDTNTKIGWRNPSEMTYVNNEPPSNCAVVKQSSPHVSDGTTWEGNTAFTGSDSRSLDSPTSPNEKHKLKRYLDVDNAHNQLQSEAKPVNNTANDRRNSTNATTASFRINQLGSTNTPHVSGKTPQHTAMLKESEIFSNGWGKSTTVNATSTGVSDPIRRSIQPSSGSVNRPNGWGRSTIKNVSSTPVPKSSTGWGTNSTEDAASKLIRKGVHPSSDSSVLASSTKRWGQPSVRNGSPICVSRSPKGMGQASSENAVSTPSTKFSKGWEQHTSTRNTSSTKIPRLQKEPGQDSSINSSSSSISNGKEVISVAKTKTGSTSIPNPPKGSRQTSERDTVSASMHQCTKRQQPSEKTGVSTQIVNSSKELIRTPVLEVVPKMPPKISQEPVWNKEQLIGETSKRRGVTNLPAWMTKGNKNNECNGTTVVAGATSAVPSKIVANFPEETSPQLPSSTNKLPSETSTLDASDLDGSPVDEEDADVDVVNDDVVDTSEEPIKETTNKNAEGTYFEFSDDLGFFRYPADSADDSASDVLFDDESDADSEDVNSIQSQFSETQKGRF